MAMRRSVTGTPPRTPFTAPSGLPARHRFRRLTASRPGARAAAAVGSFAIPVLALGVLGLPTVDTHTPLHHLGIMDPLCGGTRATVALLRAHPLLAWRYNPGVLAGPPLLALAVRLRHRVRRRVLVAAGLVLVAALTAHQQIHAPLLREDRAAFCRHDRSLCRPVWM